MTFSQALGFDRAGTVVRQASDRAARAQRPPELTERPQILHAIRPFAGLGLRFIVHELRVIPGKAVTYADAMVEPIEAGI